MKNLFERETVDEVIPPIDTRRPTTPRQWGKMDVAQMLAHCPAAMDMASDRLKLPRRFIGRLLGPFVKPIVSIEKPRAKKDPTAKGPEFSHPRESEREQQQRSTKMRQ